MKYYVKPCNTDDNLEHIILNVETNGLNSENSSERIAKSIAGLANILISEKRRVVISGIIPGNDERNNKAEDGNSHLTDMCKTLSTGVIDNISFNPKKHLANSKLHLNEKGSPKLG